ncbi:hypothetical protein ASE48_08390 [Mycobacterium sp. Root265]|uniref:DUF7302 family protein n=1 Tax=Mycobacterium sp. Root265 TaxID=1736504 RepID=UPI00070D8B69|nr:hypothetical protein [Mycobacterium sp. Root265]KRD08575.1 hypothetical protein ASE48_08390 [Mycobacterium sp. Root265]
MQIRSTLNGGTAEVSDEFAEKLIETGQWVSGDTPIKPKRIRRTQAQIAADNAAEAAAKNQE